MTEMKQCTTRCVTSQLTDSLGATLFLLIMYILSRAFDMQNIDDLHTMYDYASSLLTLLLLQSRT